MARDLTGFVCDMLLDEGRAGRFGGLSWYTHEDHLTWLRRSSGVGPVRDAGTRWYGDRVQLRPTAWFGGSYRTGESNAAWFGGYLRTVPEAKQWAVIELCCSAPAGTEVRFLLAGAAGAALRWNGAAWVAADVAVKANWNTEAQVKAGFPSWTGTAVRVLYRLETADAGATPTVYGALAMARLWAPSMTEDAVLRTLLPWLAAVRLPVRLAEAADGTASISLAGLREYPADRVTPFSVHDTTADPGCAVELLAGWNAGTKVITLTGVVAAGHELLVDLWVVPAVARMTHQDYLRLAELPAVVVEGVTVVDTPGRHVPDAVADRAALTARAVDRPSDLRVSFDLRLVAAYDVDVERLCDAVDRLPRDAVSLVTGEPMSVRRLGDWELRDGELSAKASFEGAGAVGWSGLDAAVRLVGTVEGTVGDAG